MPKLKGFVEKLEDVEEGFRPLYVQTEDGKFKLDAEGVEDVKGLKSALEKEREAARIARAEAAKYKDVDPEKYREMLAAAEDQERKSLEAKGQYEQLLTQVKEKHTKELTAAKAETGEVLTELESLLVDNQAIIALTEAKPLGAPTVLLPHVKSQVKVIKENGRRVARVVDEKGNVRIGDASGAPMTIPQLVAEMRDSKEYGAYFQADNKTGSGAPVDKGKPPTPGKPLVLSREDAKDPKKYQAAKAQAAKEGREFKIEPPPNYS